MNIKKEETAGPSKNIFMFEYSKKNFSGIDYGQYSKSPPCSINNLMWRIMITKKKADVISKDPKGKDSLGVYLECLGKSKLWSCYALVRFTLITQNPDVSKNFSLEFQHLFSASSISHGYHTFASWNKVCNPEFGYIINDMIRIQVYVEADAPKNISTQDCNLQLPQVSDDWLSSFENKLNDKIVRRIAEEIEPVNEKMKNYDKLSEEIKGLNVKMERVHNRGLKNMSEFLIKCLKIIISSFHSKLDSLKLEDFHTEMVSILGELRRIRSVESEDKANEKSRNENDANSSSENSNEKEANSCSANASESSAEEAERTVAQSGRKGEPQMDCEILEENTARETITISSSESDDESPRKNAPCDGDGANKVATKPVVSEERLAVSTMNSFKTLDSECPRESSKCCQPQLGCGHRVCGRHTKVITYTCSEVGSVSNHCSAKARPTCCEFGSQLSNSCCQVKVETSLKRKLDADCTRSSASNGPSKKNKCSDTETVKDDSDDSTSSSSTCSCSLESSHSCSSEDEKPQAKKSKCGVPIV